MAVTVHKPAAVHRFAELGEGTVVWTFASVGMNTKTGPGCVIGSCAYVGHNCRLGENVHIQHGAFIPNRTVVGDRVFIGPNVSMTDDRHPRVINPQYKAEPPVIDDDASIGAGATLLPGVHIGRGAVVGAGAVVTRDVAPYTTVIGCPAQPLRSQEIAV